MDVQAQPATFKTVGQWHTWQLILDLAEFRPALPQGLPDCQAEPYRRGEQSLYRFFQDLLADVYAYPEAYGVPQEAYVAYYETSQGKDQALEDRIRARRLKARKAIDLGILDFLYQVGQAGALQGQALTVNCAFYDRLLADKLKKAKTTAFLQGLARLGLSIEVGSQAVRFENANYPGMLAILADFARACAQVRKEGFYYFRRCDLQALGGKSQPAFEDALHLAPEPLRGEVMAVDALLQRRKFKRELLVSEAGGAGYRLRYSKKGDQLVYWCRLRNWFYPDLHHNLRWDFESSLTPRLFAGLDGCAPGLSAQVFAGIKQCDHCFDNCMAISRLEYQGGSYECCREAGWDQIGVSPSEFETLRLVIGLLDDLLGGRATSDSTP
jgi:hypothetical protein